MSRSGISSDEFLVFITGLMLSLKFILHDVQLHATLWRRLHCGSKNLTLIRLQTAAQNMTQYQ